MESARGREEGGAVQPRAEEVLWAKEDFKRAEPERLKSGQNEAGPLGVTSNHLCLAPKEMVGLHHLLPWTGGLGT